MSTFWMILAVLRLAYKTHGATLGWPLAVAFVEYLGRYYEHGSHRLTAGKRLASLAEVYRPVTAIPARTVPRLVVWA
jgi:hypothetical protein